MTDTPDNGSNSNGNNWGPASITRLIAGGVLPGFLLAYLLGAVPGLPSPIAKMVGALEAQAAATGKLEERLREHDAANRRYLLEQINAARATCRGVWMLAKKEWPEASRRCGGTVAAIEDDPFPGAGR